MDPVSITLASFTILEQCLKYGKVIVGLYNDYQHTETELSETLLKLQVIWMKTETQTKVLKKIWQTLPSDHQQTQLSLLSVLEVKLRETCHTLDSIIGKTSEHSNLDALTTKKGSLNKFSYAVIKKKELNKRVAELLEWHKLFDDVWCVLARIPNHVIDQNLQPYSTDAAVKLLIGLRKSARELSSEDNEPSREISSYDFLESRSVIKASCAAIAQFEDRTDYAIIDRMLTNPRMDILATTRCVRALTKALSRSEPATFGLLRCCGVINKTTEYQFVFEIPADFIGAPRSLRDLLLYSHPSLNIKVDVARQLSNSVLHLHAMGFIHKNIRPDSTLVFDRGDDKAVFLVGFENYRATKDETFLRGDERPERELYRHPLRQGSNPQRRYVMQHDIYSLGVCLLEIGLWKSFIRIGQHEVVIDFGIDPNIEDSTKRANAIKKKLLIMVDEQLPPLVGAKYAHIVRRCLTWLDKENVDGAGGPEADVGLEFINDVLSPLREILV